MSSTSRQIAAGLALAIAISACGSDSSVGPSSNYSATLTGALAELTPLALSLSSTAPAGLPDISFKSFDGSSCGYRADTQDFACLFGNVGGLLVRQSYTLFDAAGTKQNGFNGSTTNTIRAHTTVTGTLITGADRYSVDGQQDLALSDLLTENHVLNGTSTTTITSLSGGTLFPATTIVSTAIDHLTFPRGTRSGPAWPTSGSVAVQAAGLTSDVALIKVVITFSGSSRVAVAVTSAGFSKSCTVDLASQAPTCS